MLVHDRNAQNFQLLLKRCQQQLRIPESYRQRLLQREERPSIPGDKRQFPRKKLIRLAILEYQSSLPALSRAREYHVIQFLDLSRGGVGFLHGEQLFPGELKSIHLEIAKKYTVEIVNCRKIAEHCYQIGARFASPRIIDKPGAV